MVLGVAQTPFGDVLRGLVGLNVADDTDFLLQVLHHGAAARWTGGQMHQRRRQCGLICRQHCVFDIPAVCLARIASA
jgi:hypothetical protein